MISPIQIKAARAILDWNQDRLSEVAGVAKRTIVSIEQGNVAARIDTLNAIQDALELHGIEFLSGNGVRPRDDMVVIYEGEGAEERLLNDIYETMLLEGKGSEILIYGLDEASEEDNPQGYALAQAQLERLKRAGIKERIISREGNMNFSAPWHYYRWVPADMDFITPLFIYGSKIALNNENAPYKSIVIESELFSNTCRHLFNFAWERASIPPSPEVD